MGKENALISGLDKTEEVSAVPCKICGDSAPLFDVVDFGKFCDQGDYYSFGLTGIPIYYRKCVSCGLIFTNSFDNLDIAGFSALIYNDDYLKFDPDYVERRPRTNASFLARLLSPIKRSVKGLDWGGGNGLTAAILVRDGWNFHSCDPISNPVDASEKFKDFNVISCLEVFEHVPFPLRAMEQLLDYAADDCLLIVGTQVSDEVMTNSRLDWWYAGPRNGHITLHSRDSLRILLERYGFRYQSLDPGCHIGIRLGRANHELRKVVDSISSTTPRKLSQLLFKGRVAARRFLHRLAQSLRR